MQVTEQQNALLQKHLALVVEANETTNITRIDSIERAQILHIEDSLVAWEELLAAPSGLYGDLGSGAGYPGIPLAIVSGRETLLVESVKKKAHLLEHFAQELGLSSQITVFDGRAEELAASHRNSFSVLSARALSKLGSLMELASPLLTIGGQLICYKAHIEDEEMETALRLKNTLGLELLSDRDLYLSDSQTYRRIVVFQKFKNASIKLPRRNGMAQRQPL